MRPVASFHRAHGYYMDLFAVFSLAAVNGCAGQGSARCKHNRKPKGGIAVIARLRGGEIACLAAAGRFIGIRIGWSRLLLWIC